MKHYYSDTIYNKTIAIIGRYPPPWGGISVHVQRVIKKLQGQRNQVFFFEAVQKVRFVFFFLYAIKLFFFLMWYRPHIIFYHTLYLKYSLRELWLVIQLKKILSYQVIIIDHNFRHLQTQPDIFKQHLNNLISFIAHQVFIGSITEHHYREYGITKPISWSIESAFLPPDLAQEQIILNSYPVTLFHFMQRHGPLIIANASHLVLLPDGRDLYGFDICLNMIQHLKKTLPNIGLIFALPTIGNQHYFDQLQTIIIQNQLRECVYFLLEQKELWPLFKKVQVFVRPTLSDSDGISIHEALYVRLPVVASDVCERPSQVHLFNTGDRDDCLKKVMGVLSGYEKFNIGFSHLYEKSS
jgi:glycosyltransferase involved in cell wall biosynthesis